ncbi:MAG: hypothetical protein H5U40_02120, partial [Polyangiaceae bacterium]|nr:hypothetical protein [Polyangiaceae bacterium]
MQVAATPLLIVAAIAVYVGVYHLYVAWRVPRRAADAAFGLLCLSAAFYAGVSAGPFLVTTAAESLYVHRLGDSWAFLFAATWLVFVHRYTGEG